MKNNFAFLITGALSIICCPLLGQTVALEPGNIPTLNRIAGEYDFWKWIFGLAAVLLAIWSFFGLRFFLRTKVNDWVDIEIAKKAGLKIETLKDALAEYARTGELKKMKILVLGIGDGQEGNVKKMLDKTGFSNYEWGNISNISTIVLKNVHLLLLNDQPGTPISQTQIDDTIEKFGKDVACLYFGPKHPLPINEYRSKQPLLNLGLCNSADRLETGILSLLKIV